MKMIIPFTERLSEQWLIERTYHAQLLDGRELAVPSLTEAMKQLTDFDNPLSSQSGTSKLAEKVPVKSANCYVPFPAWKEASLEEAHTAYQQGIPILLYAEHPWTHPRGTAETRWSANKNMRVIISGNAEEYPTSDSGIEYAVCYLDLQRGTFSNPAWKAWFASDTALEGDHHGAVTFFSPCVQFPYTTHYAVIAADGRVHEYASSAAAVQGYQTLSPREASSGSQVQTAFPQFCYYHEVICPSGVYRIEFFGSRTDEQGYQVKEAA